MTASHAHFTETARALLERDNLAVYEKAFAEGLADLGRGLSDERISRERGLPLATVQRWRRLGYEHGEDVLDHLGAGARFLAVSFEQYDDIARHLRYPFRTRFEKAACALAALARGSLMAELAKSWDLGAGIVLTWKAAFEKGGIAAVAAAEGVELEGYARPSAAPPEDPQTSAAQDVQPELPLLVQKTPQSRPEPLPPLPHSPSQSFRRAEDGRRTLESVVRPPFAPEKKLAEKQSTLLFPEPQRKNGQTVKRSPVTVMRKGSFHRGPKRPERQDEPERIIEPIRVVSAEPVREIKILEPINWPVPSYYPEPEEKEADREPADLHAGVEEQEIQSPAEAEPEPEPELEPPVTVAARAAPEVRDHVVPAEMPQPKRRVAKAVTRKAAGKRAPPPRTGPARPAPSPAPTAVLEATADPPPAAGTFFSGKNAHRWHAVMELRASGNMRAVTSKYGVSPSTLEKWVVAYATSPAARM